MIYQLLPLANAGEKPAFINLSGLLFTTIVHPKQNQISVVMKCDCCLVSSNDLSLSFLNGASFPTIMFFSASALGHLYVISPAAGSLSAY